MQCAPMKSKEDILEIFEDTQTARGLAKTNWLLHTIAVQTSGQHHRPNPQV